MYKDELSSFEKIVTDSHVTIVRPFLVHNIYILLFLMSPFVQKDLE